MAVFCKLGFYWLEWVETGMEEMRLDTLELFDNGRLLCFVNVMGSAFSKLVKMRMESISREKYGFMLIYSLGGIV